MNSLLVSSNKETTAKPPRDTGEVERAISGAMARLWPQEGVVELRILGSAKGVISGYYDDVQSFARDAARWSGRAAGIYWTINPCNPALQARANNRLREYVSRGGTTSDVDIIRRRFLPVDIDPVRPSGVCATHEEHCEALALQGRLINYLVSEGYPAPLEMDSGNGAYALIRIDLPNDEGTTQALKGCLVRLASKFDTDKVRIDTSTYNASRILRVPYTKNCKGDHTPERPHRRALVTHWPEGIDI